MRRRRAESPHRRPGAHPLNSADRAQIEAYIQKHAAPTDSADAMLDFRNMTGGVELLRIESSEPRAIVYRIKELGRPRHNFARMVVSATDPPRVTSSFMRVVPPSVTAMPNFDIDVATRDLVIDSLNEDELGRHGRRARRQSARRGRARESAGAIARERAARL